MLDDPVAKTAKVTEGRGRATTGAVTETVAVCYPVAVVVIVVVVVAVVVVEGELVVVVVVVDDVAVVVADVVRAAVVVGVVDRLVFDEQRCGAWWR